MGIEPNKPTIYRSAVGNWARWAKLISEVAQIQGLTEFRQPIHVQSHLEMPGILVQLGHIQRT